MNAGASGRPGDLPVGNDSTRPRLVRVAKAAPVQKRSIAARSAIVEAAAALFKERGYDRAHIDDIIERAGVSAGLLYRYFASKQDLLLFLMDEYLAYLASLGFDRLEFASDNAVSQVHDALWHALGAETKYAGLWRAWCDATRSDPGLLGARAAVDSWMTATVAKAAENAIASGLGDGLVAPTTIAFVAKSLVWALSEVPPDQLGELVTGVAHMLVRAVGIPIQLDGASCQ